jgi:hypothetical protein
LLLGALLALVKYPVSRSRISFPIATVLISVAVYLSRGIIANTLHAFRQVTLVLVGLVGDARGETAWQGRGAQTESSWDQRLILTILQLHGMVAATGMMSIGLLIEIMNVAA